MIELLRNEEKAILSLRRLYQNFGYRPFKMSKFETYELYMQNKEFLVSEGVISFTDADGTLLALKPDVTLSIIKNYRHTPETIEKIYYDETVYRRTGDSGGYREILQTGLECMGDLNSRDLSQVVFLATKSLEAISPAFALHLSHMGILSAVMETLPLSQREKSDLLSAYGKKDQDRIRRICTSLTQPQLHLLLELAQISGSLEDALLQLAVLPLPSSAFAAVEELTVLSADLAKEGLSDRIYLDLSIVNDMNYYNGVVFRGYLAGIPRGILSGGQYDGLMQKMGKNAAGAGFAVYLDQLEYLERDQSSRTDRTKQMVNVALPKGRLGEKIYEMFERAGFDCPGIRESSRKLVFENETAGVRFFWVKPSDVAIYVERGAADIGVVGKDILLEYQPDVYELLDLKQGNCRMAVAGPQNFRDDPEKTLRVATKFPRITKNYYGRLCRSIDIIHLNGSIELAPILGLSDVIVDIVETGTTLLENGLVPLETIVPVSARLISNKVSHQFKNQQIQAILRSLKGQVR